MKSVTGNTVLLLRWKLMLHVLPIKMVQPGTSITSWSNNKYMLRLESVKMAHILTGVKSTPVNIIYI